MERIAAGGGRTSAIYHPGNVDAPDEEVARWEALSSAYEAGVESKDVIRVTVTPL